MRERRGNVERRKERKGREGREERREGREEGRKGRVRSRDRTYYKRVGQGRER